MVTQSKFLTSLQDRLKGSSSSEVTQALNQLRDEITKPSNIRIFVSGDMGKIHEDLIKPWSDFPTLPVNLHPG